MGSNRQIEAEIWQFGYLGYKSKADEERCPEDLVAVAPLTCSSNNEVICLVYTETIVGIAE
jgi:hypothetical protein